MAGFSHGQLLALAYNDEAPTSTQLLARELIELRARPRDAFHTMEELYEQRMLWNALAVYLLDEETPGRVTKSWRHHDGEPCFGKTAPGERWFVVTVHLPDGRFEQVVQHYPERDWDLFDCPEMPAAPHWDGHTPEQGNARIRRFLLRRRERAAEAAAKAGSALAKFASAFAEAMSKVDEIRAQAEKETTTGGGDGSVR